MALKNNTDSTDTKKIATLVLVHINWSLPATYTWILLSLEREIS
jgi:hypothetical protein